MAALPNLEEYDPGPLAELPLTVLARLASQCLAALPRMERDAAQAELDETLRHTQVWRYRRVYIDFLYKNGVSDGR